MANKLRNEQDFGVTGAYYGPLSLTYSITSGTVQLQKLCGNDSANDTWIDVENGEFTTTGEKTFWAPKGQKYRVQFTDATVYVAG